VKADPSCMRLAIGLPCGQFFLGDLPARRGLFGAPAGLVTRIPIDALTHKERCVVLNEVPTDALREWEEREVLGASRRVTRRMIRGELCNDQGAARMRVRFEDRVTVGQIKEGAAASADRCDPEGGRGGSGSCGFRIGCSASAAGSARLGGGSAKPSATRL
jgi:hypothetical protein